ncbi:MAG: hypothetical protein WC859_00835 [Elusimicrobiota bacterium]|jgi:hypothetical protein
MPTSVAPNPDLVKVFEIADDALIALRGYHAYVADAILRPLNDYPTIPTDGLQITHDWKRLHDKDILITQMTSAFEIVHARNAILIMVSILEAAIVDFLEVLGKTGHPQTVKNNYKARIIWSIPFVKRTDYGGANWNSRADNVCQDVDHARRIRNLLMHNNGTYAPRYSTDVITSLGTPKCLATWKGATDTGPVDIRAQDYYQLSQSHTEFLHRLHHELQKSMFGCTGSYGYAKKGKLIEWERIIKRT